MVLAGTLEAVGMVLAGTLVSVGTQDSVGMLALAAHTILGGMNPAQSRLCHQI